MNTKSPEEYDAEKGNELHERVSAELKAHDNKNFLEQYALYMLRVQMFELSLKRDLQQRFDVSEKKAERMNLSSIFRFYVKHDIRAHPSLYVDIQNIAEKRNSMAHEFLAVAGSLTELTGGDGMRLLERDLDKRVLELEYAFQRYVMLKDTEVLYQDWGVNAAQYQRINT